jgi:hypothetical protein
MTSIPANAHALQRRAAAPSRIPVAAARRAGGAVAVAAGLRVNSMFMVAADCDLGGAMMSNPAFIPR